MAARSRKKPARKAPEAIASWREGGDRLDALAQNTAQALAARQVEAAQAHFRDYRSLLLTHLAHE
jgi:hypothetical protein